MTARGRAVGLVALLISIACGESPTAPAPPPPPTVHVHIASTTAGRLRLTMSTSFQPAEWNFSFFQQFADYTRQLVRYYNRGGFSAADGRHSSPSPFAITWWGIYNEPNINRLTAAQYVDLYNAVVPAMHSVDGSLRFAAVELADFGNEPQKYLPTFVAGVRAPVDVMATPFYSSSN